MSSPLVVKTIAEIRSELATLRADGKTVALVPTLGALHKGHMAHVKRAKKLADVVVVSIFVNPLQFGANEDLDKYPRDLDADLERLAKHDVAYVFAPTVEQMYPDGGTQVKVTGGEVAGLYEGRARPGHFNGVLTVVAKLLQIVQPNVVTFGQKDAQQLFLVQRMVKDLDIPVASRSSRPCAKTTDSRCRAATATSTRGNVKPRARSVAPSRLPNRRATAASTPCSLRRSRC